MSLVQLVNRPSHEARSRRDREFLRRSYQAKRKSRTDLDLRKIGRNDDYREANTKGRYQSCASNFGTPQTWPSVNDSRLAATQVEASCCVPTFNTSSSSPSRSNADAGRSTTELSVFFFSFLRTCCCSLSPADTISFVNQDRQFARATKEDR